MWPTLCWKPDVHLRVLSHLARCFSEPVTFPPLPRLFGHMWTRQSHSDPRQNNRSEIAWTRWSRLDWKTVEWFSCSENAIRSNGPMNQAISQCMMGSYVSSMKAVVCCFTITSKLTCECLWVSTSLLFKIKALFNVIMPSYCYCS